MISHPPSHAPPHQSTDRLSRFLSIGAFLISILNLALDGYRDILQNADTHAFNDGTNLDIRFDPVEKRFEFQFPAVLDNVGNKDGRLSNPLVTLVRVRDGQAQPLNDAGLMLSSDGSQSEELPIAVPRGSRRFTFRVVAPVDALRALLEEDPDRRLQVQVLADGKRPLTLMYCFYITRTGLESFLESASLEPKRFLRAACNPTPTKAVS